MGFDVVVVGAGFAGSVIAERMASQLGKRVLVLDRRQHVGGNAFDEPDDAGILIHRYGPHIFHTNSADIFEYLSGFTDWRPYEHRVLAQVRRQLVPIPINRTTINRLFGLELHDEAAVEQFYRDRSEPGERARTSEDVVVQGVGRELYELFFRGYTRKQWGLDPSQLDASVTARVPARTDADDRYFTDRFQAMPAAGYTRMFEHLLANPLIEVRTSVDFHDVRDGLDYGQLIYTGPIDAFFGYRFGPLPYRSLRFEFETLAMERYQPTGTVNYPDEAIPFTRISEFKHLTGQAHEGTTIVREFPTAEGDPYYPIPRPDNRALYERYAALAAATPGVEFVGRLGTYKYYNMDQVVGQALATYRRLAAQLEEAA
jgi:UDP-galactopyranose mutase